MIRLALASTALTVCLACASAAPAQQDASPPVATDPMTFVTQAAQSDEFERREGRLAAQKGRHSEVRAFAAEMVHDHTVSTRELQEAVRKAGMTPPPPPELNPDQEKMLAALQAADGASFDHIYADQQVMAHKQAEALLESYTQSGPPGPVRDAAGQILSTVKNHLGKAMTLAQQLATT